MVNILLVFVVCIYYVYEEVDGCDYNCVMVFIIIYYFFVVVFMNCEFFIGLVCMEVGFNNFNNVINVDIMDWVLDLFILVEFNYFDLDIGEDILAGYEVGFMVE